MGVPEQLSDEADHLFYQHYSIFHSSLKELVTQLSGNTELTAFLTRILEGTMKCFAQFKSRLTLVRRNGAEVIANLNLKIREMNQEHLEFRQKNNLDHFFE